MATRKPTANHSVDLVTPAELARMRGAHRSSATRFLARHPECVVAGKANAAHPTARAWLRGDPPAEQPKNGGAGRRGRGAAPQPPPADWEPEEAGLPTRAEFSAVAYRKAKADAEAAERRNAVRAGRLIPREYVRHHIFGTVDASLRRLLEVIPTVEETVALAVSSGTQREERIAAVEKLVTRELSSVKRRVAQSLKRCEPLENPPQVAEFGEATDARVEKHLRDFADAVVTALVGTVTDRIVDSVAKVIARRACGQVWAPEVFDAAGLNTTCRDEVTPMVASMLRAAVEAEFKNAASLSDHQQPLEAANVQTVSESNKES